MVWARGHKNDFDHWAKEAGDDAWNYRHVLDIYRRIEDWHGVKKLRIADGSIMPTITTGNTQAPCVIIGERLAEILNA
jgi:choline dehydrogenase-like flavoprotein